MFTKKGILQILLYIEATQTSPFHKKICNIFYLHCSYKSKSKLSSPRHVRVPAGREIPAWYFLSLMRFIFVHSFVVLFNFSKVASLDSLLPGQSTSPRVLLFSLPPRLKMVPPMKEAVWYSRSFDMDGRILHFFTESTRNSTSLFAFLLPPVIKMPCWPLYDPTVQP